MRPIVNGRPRRDADIVHVHTTGPYAAVLLLTGRGAKVASAHVVPDSLRGSIVGARILRRLIRAYLTWFYNRADLVIAVSEAVQADLTAMQIKTPIKIIPNWVRVTEARQSPSLRASLGLGESDVLVVSVGQMQPRKGVTGFLAAARALPQLQFLWVGDAIFGPASSGRITLRRALASAPPNVRWAGQVPRERVYDFLAAADIYLSLSEHETFGLAVLEAASFGCPLVLADLPVFRTTYGDAAQYSPPGGPAPLLSALAGSAAERRQWGARAAGAARKYDAESGGEQLLAAYRRLLSR
ncbi:hypothetical protein Ate02nite_28420 [Paractinoplanes tereljensis]|uniref:Glycosyltransferase n=2 Tax=Paractinoplanes tereljensis TaxID=571912 RepID=A0A919NM37_9ACTN|nr:hypothetical protein Ate02nite_28420 [Actinoplanes tereljensis]